MAPPAPRIDLHTVSDGITLRYRHFVPDREQRGFVVAFHGIHSHSGWYGRSSTRLAEAGYDVRFVDRRGCGLSDGRRGHAPHSQRLVNDAISLLTWLRRERDARAHRLPIILLAVSWGGRLAAAVARQRPDLVDGLALLYPGISSRIRPRPLQTAQLRLARLLGVRYRRAPIPLDDPELFTSDPAAQEFIRTDPLTLHQATAGFFLADQELTRIAQSSGPFLRIPTLMMLAGRDRICDVESSRAYFKTIAALDKTLIEFPDATHTLEFDPCFEDFLAALISWLGHFPHGAGQEPRDGPSRLKTS